MMDLKRANETGSPREIMLAYWQLMMDLGSEPVGNNDAPVLGKIQSTGNRPSEQHLELLAKLAEQDASKLGNVHQFQQLMEEGRSISEEMGQDQAEKLLRGMHRCMTMPTTSALLEVRLIAMNKENAIRKVEGKGAGIGARSNSRGLLNHTSFVDPTKEVPSNPKITPARPQGQFTSPAKVSIDIE